MLETHMKEQFYTSKVDGKRDRYLIEYPSAPPYGPLVLYLHGGLSHAEQAFCEDYEWCFRRLRDEVMRRRGVYVSPEYRGDSWMNEAAEQDTVALIKEIKAQFGIEDVIITGGSMGGTAALILAVHHPELIQGVVALCPATDMRALHNNLRSREELVYKHLAKSICEVYGGTPEENPREYDYRSSILHAENLTMPVVTRHGEADRVIDVSHARSMVEKLRAQGTPVLYDEMPGGDHDAPTVQTPWHDYLEFIRTNWE